MRDPLGVSNLAAEDYNRRSRHWLQRCSEKSHAAPKNEDGPGDRAALGSV